MRKIIVFFLSFVMFFSTGFSMGGYTLKQAADIAADPYNIAGWELAGLLMRKCSSLTGHRLYNKTDEREIPYVWPAASYAEMLCDAYRMFPANVGLRLHYTDALTRIFDLYKVENATVAAPGGTYSGVTYYNAVCGQKDDFFYDDNAWVCIQLLLGYRNLGRKDLLAAAEKNLEFLWTGHDGALGGGIYWSYEFKGKHACDNAPIAIAELLAYQCTGKELYLERGKELYRWMNDTLREGDLFSDAIQLDGTVSRWKGVYNQATMIYAGSLLYEITGDRTYYDLTKATVDATVGLAFDSAETEDGGERIVMRENPIFKAWCVGWLARSYVKFFETDPLKNVLPMEHLKAVLDDELQTRDEDGLYDPFFCSGGEDAENYTDLLSQCGVAATFLCAGYYNAVLKNAAADPGRLTDLSGVSKSTGLAYTEMGKTVMDAFIGKYYDNGRLAGSCFWSDAEIVETFLDAYEQTGNPAYLTYARETAENGFLGAKDENADWSGNQYNDDIAWGAVALNRLYQATGEKRYLKIAKNNFDLMFGRGWSDDLGGGLWWNDGTRDRKTSCTQCPAAIAACLLSRNLKNAEYLDKAKQIMAWTVRELFDRESGKVYDAYWTDGRKDTWAFTYTQGTFIGACMLLWQADGCVTYLDRADAAERFTFRDMGYDENGIFNWEIRNEFDIDGFKGILTRWLYRYAVERNDIPALEWLQRHADAAYSHRNSENIICSDWALQTEDGREYNVFSASTAIALLFNCEPRK